MSKREVCHSFCGEKLCLLFYLSTFVSREMGLLDMPADWYVLLVLFGTTEVNVLGVGLHHYCFLFLLLKKKGTCQMNVLMSLRHEVRDFCKTHTRWNVILQCFLPTDVRVHLWIIN